MKSHMRPLVALAAIFLLAAARAPIKSGPIQACTADQGSCRSVRLSDVRFAAPETLLTRVVDIDPAAMPLQRPPMVWVIALASSEVRWNGALVGRNGVPGRDRSSERPGRYVATFVVPDRLVRPGRNVVSVRLTAHHLWLPVRSPVHQFDVVAYETPVLPGLGYYLPALLMLGALLGAGVYFGAAAWSDKKDRSALRLAGVAGSASLQLVVEVSRSFVPYTYPWHLARVATIALLAAVTATLIAAYAANRFSPRWGRQVVVGTALAAIASLILIPWFDLKALAAILAGTFALGACALGGIRRQRSEAVLALVTAMTIVAAMSFELTLFLDRGWFMIVAALLVLLVARQVGSLKRARQERDLERLRSAGLAERLSRAERSGEPIVSLKDGARTHRVAESDILYVRAADDYCEVTLCDSRTLLVTESLSRLLQSLPPRFLRVHRSYAVNRSHVLALSSRPGGGKLLKLSNGDDVPVGRRYGVLGLA